MLCTNANHLASFGMICLIFVMSFRCSSHIEQTIKWNYLFSCLVSVVSNDICYIKANVLKKKKIKHFIFSFLLFWKRLYNYVISSNIFTILLSSVNFVIVFCIRLLAYFILLFQEHNSNPIQTNINRLTFQANSRTQFSRSNNGQEKMSARWKLEHTKKWGI